LDSQTKLIRIFKVTPANMHDSQPIGILLDREDDAGQELYADAAYVCVPIRCLLNENDMKDLRNKKSMKNAPLSSYQIRQNRIKSNVRARVERTFGPIRMKMGDIHARSIGEIRAMFVIGMCNLLYKVCRVDSIQRIQDEMG
jgi:IS5 family transposase